MVAHRAMVSESSREYSGCCSALVSGVVGLKENFTCRNVVSLW